MFHVKDGWYFERLNNGSVRVVKQVDYKQAWGQPPYAADLIIDVNAWASIVSSMSVGGEANGRFYEALDFHTGSNHNPATGAETKEETALPRSPAWGAGDLPLLPEGLLVRTNAFDMFDEIKQYTNKYPGEIKSADLPRFIMLGFIHDDGTYWGIRMSDLKKSLDKPNQHPSLPYDRNVLIKNSMQTHEGKKALCVALSNVEGMKK